MAACALTKCGEGVDGNGVPKLRFTVRPADCYIHGLGMIPEAEVYSGVAGAEVAGVGMDASPEGLALW